KPYYVIRDRANVSGAAPRALIAAHRCVPLRRHLSNVTLSCQELGASLGPAMQPKGECLTTSPQRAPMSVERGTRREKGAWPRSVEDENLWSFHGFHAGTWSTSWPLCWSRAWA